MSNDCSGSRLYDYLGLVNISPTFLSMLNYESFLKLCSNPAYYLNKNLEKVHFARTFVGYPNSVGHDSDIAFNIDDIEIFFVHDKNPEDVKDRWDALSSHINPNRFIYLLAERWGTFPYDILEKFSKFNGQKLLLLTSPNYYGNVLKNFPTVNWQVIYNLDCVIENFFDLLGWINNEFTNENVN